MPVLLFAFVSPHIAQNDWSRKESELLWVSSAWWKRFKKNLIFFSHFKKDAAFPDGQTPPPEIRDQWFTLLKEQFRTSPNKCVAIHCVAGLGRAPVMVALALMELGMSYEEAVDLIRIKRKGALNSI